MKKIEIILDDAGKLKVNSQLNVVHTIKVFSALIMEGLNKFEIETSPILNPDGSNKIKLTVKDETAEVN